MKILLFLPEMGGGGAQRTMVNLANIFSAGGRDVALCVAHNAGPAGRWIDNSVEPIDLNAERARYSVLALARLIRQRRPDVLFASMVDANIIAWAAWLLAGSSRPRLVLRETNSHLARGDLGRLRRMLIGAAYRAADRVVALSHGVRDELIALYRIKPARIVTIHNPVDGAAIAAAVTDARAQAPPLPGSGPLILGIGRLTRQKGFDRLIEMFAALPVADARLAILGEGEDRQALTDLAKRLGVADRVFMPGFVEDPWRWLAHADVFALPSRWEGFGHVIVEAMAAGVPVVAFDCPHGPRDIIADGVNGLLAPAGDERRFGDGLARMLTDEAFAGAVTRAALQDAGRYALPKVSQKYLDLFGSI